MAMLIAWAAMVMPALLLQCPQSHGHLAYLEQRLPLWKDGNILGHAGFSER